MDHNACLTIFISVNVIPVNYVVVWYLGLCSCLHLKIYIQNHFNYKQSLLWQKDLKLWSLKYKFYKEAIN